MTSMLYRTEGRIENLKSRANRCVCKYCGSPLSLRQIVFSDIEEVRVEIFCKQCDRIEYGIEPELYSTACDFVDHLQFRFYDTTEDDEVSRQMNIGKVCEILAWNFKNMGLLNQNGLQIVMEKQKYALSECVVLEADAIDAEKT